MELISAHGPERNQCLGVATIYNDGTGTHSIGNYKVNLSQRGNTKKNGHRKTWRRGAVQGFKRLRFTAWDLLLLSLMGAVGPDRLMDLIENTGMAVQLDQVTGEKVTDLRTPPALAEATQDTQA